MRLLLALRNNDFQHKKNNNPVLPNGRDGVVVCLRDGLNQLIQMLQKGFGVVGRAITVPDITQKSCSAESQCPDRRKIVGRYPSQCNDFGIYNAFAGSSPDLLH